MGSSATSTPDQTPPAHHRASWTDRSDRSDRSDSGLGGTRTHATTAAAEDDWLVEQARRGDLEAFEVLVTHHQDRIFRIALRMLGDRSDAEDLTQDVVVQLWTGLGAFAGKSRFTTWLHRVVINRCLDELRRRRPHEPMLEPDDTRHPRTPGTSERAEDRARLDAATAALARLPDPLRVVFVLHQLEGLSYREIAAVTAVSEATVRGRLHRARQQLAHAMREWS